MEAIKARRGQLVLLGILSTDGLVASILLPGSMTLLSKGVAIVGVILITTIKVVALQMHRWHGH